MRNKIPSICSYLTELGSTTAGTIPLAYLGYALKENFETTLGYFFAGAIGVVAGHIAHPFAEAVAERKKYDFKRSRNTVITSQFAAYALTASLLISTTELRAIENDVEICFLNQTVCFELEQ